MYGAGAPEGLICCDLTDEQKSWFTEGQVWPKRQYTGQLLLRRQDYAALGDLAAFINAVFVDSTASFYYEFPDCVPRNLLSGQLGSYTVGSLSYETKAGWLGVDTLAHFYSKKYLPAYLASNNRRLSPIRIPGLNTDFTAYAEPASALMSADFALCLWDSSYLDAFGSGYKANPSFPAVPIKPSDSLVFAWSVTKSPTGSDESETATNLPDDISPGDYLSLLVGGATVPAPVCASADPRACNEFLPHVQTHGLVDYCFRVADAYTKSRGFAMRRSGAPSLKEGQVFFCDVSSDSPTLREITDIPLPRTVSCGGVWRDYDENRCGYEGDDGPPEDAQWQGDLTDDSTCLARVSGFSCFPSASVLLNHGQHEGTCYYYEGDVRQEQQYDIHSYQFSASRCVAGDGQYESAPIFFVGGPWLPVGWRCDSAIVYFPVVVSESFKDFTDGGVSYDPEKSYDLSASAYVPVSFKPVGLVLGGDDGVARRGDQILWKSDQDFDELVKAAVMSVAAQTGELFRHTDKLAIRPDKTALQSAVEALRANTQVEVSIAQFDGFSGYQPYCAVYSVQSDLDLS